MIRTSRSLADGREILYFDEDAHPGTHDAPDTRDLPPVATRSQLRWDALLGEWVVVAAHRQTRTFLPPADQCPLCPSRPGRPTEIPDDDYQVVVFENRFPSLATGVATDLPPTVAGAPSPSCGPGSAAARSSSSPATTTATSPGSAATGPGWSWTCGRSGRRRCPVSRGSSRSSSSRTPARRSG